MADQMPLPIPPRTPTPISDDEHDLPRAGLGIEGAFPSSPPDSRFAFDPPSSPPSEAAQSGSARTDMLSPTFSITASSPHELYSPLTPQSAASEPPFPPAKNPFNFTTQQYTVNKPPGAGRVVSSRACLSYPYRGH